MPIFPGIFGDIHKDIRHKLPIGYGVGGPAGPIGQALHTGIVESAVNAGNYLNTTYAQFEKDAKVFWGRHGVGGSVGTKAARQSRFFMGKGAGIGFGAGIGALAGYAAGDMGGAALGGIAGGLLGNAPTGFQAAGMAMGGAALGGAIGGAPGAFAGAVGGGALGAMGPGHVGKKIWRSGAAGKAGLIGAGVLGGGTLLAAQMGGGVGVDTLLSAGATAAVGAATIGSVALGGAAGMGLHAMNEASKMPKWLRAHHGMESSLGKAFGKAAMGGTAGYAKRATKFMATRPGAAGGLLGVALGIGSALGGLAGLATRNEPIGSMAMGNREALYGMDANNLDTQALTLALHYRHQG